LKDVSFEVKHGEVVGIIGRNGAGKTILLKVLSRITEPMEGYAEIRGRVGSLLEVGTGFHPELTGRENIYLNGAILGMKRAEIDRKFDEIVAFAEVEKFIDTPVKHYSSGMYVCLAFAVAAHRPAGLTAMRGGRQRAGWRSSCGQEESWSMSELLQRLSSLSGREYSLLEALAEVGVIERDQVLRWVQQVVDDRLALAEAYLEHASACDLRRDPECRQAISRAYYATHHAGRAVAYEVHRRDVTTHEGVIAEAGQILGQRQALWCGSCTGCAIR